MGAPASFTTATWTRCQLSGNPPFAPAAMGWKLRLHGKASANEQAWLRKQGFVGAGGTWFRDDRSGLGFSVVVGYIVERAPAVASAQKDTP